MANQTESKQTLTNEETKTIITPSQKFTSRVISEFGATTAAPVTLSMKQKRLIPNCGRNLKSCHIRKILFHRISSIMTLSPKLTARLTGSSANGTLTRAR